MKHIKIELPQKSKEEMLKVLKQHSHHLIERRKGKLKTPIGIMEAEDYYCHTCKKWLNMITDFRFQSKPKRIGKKAIWVDGKPDDLSILKKTYDLSNGVIKLLKFKKDDPKFFKTLMLMWKEDNFLKDLEKLLKKYGFSKEKAIELLKGVNFNI